MNPYNAEPIPQRTGDARFDAYLGEKPQARAELFEVIRDEYGLEGEAQEFKSSFNLNVSLETPRGRFVVREYQPPLTSARLRAIDQARDAVRNSGIPTATPLPTLRGEKFVRLAGHLIEVEPFIEHDGKMDSWSRIEQAMPLLGRIHSVLARLNLGDEARKSPRANHVESSRAIEWSRRGTDHIRAWNPTPQESDFAERADELAARITATERELISELPRQLVHGDYWDNNVFFRGEKIVNVADFDFMGERARIDDLALTLFYTNSTYSEDQSSDERLRALRNLIGAYDAGLDAKLTETERLALPLAIARTPLCFVGILPAFATKEQAQRDVRFRSGDIKWCLEVVKNPKRWQDAFRARV